MTFRIVFNNFFRRYISFIIPIFSTIFAAALNAQSIDISGYVSVESRTFPESPLFAGQHRQGFSALLKPEFYYEWANGDQSVLLTPFFRFDQHDDERTHFDVRELYWQYIGSTWELRLGLRKVFWGVTESQHLVDVINQTDFVEDLDGEDKLGQPMVQFTWIRDWGTLHFFALIGFRERTFPGREGRLRFPVLIDTDRAAYESGAEEKHLDWAIRWSHTMGIFDVGLAHFSGTSREPRFLLNDSDIENPVLQPFYDLMQQTSLDLQATTGGWLFKLEAISRSSRDRRFGAFTGGFEYTFPNVKNSGIDIGVLAEYLFDDRDQNFFPFNPFDDHIFVGSRLAFNDVQSTSILAGGIIDRENGSSSLLVEADRRIGDRWKITLEARGFVNIALEDVFYSFRRDSFVQVELARYF